MEEAQPVNDRPMSAISVIMGVVPNEIASQHASSCQWEAVIKVTIQATSLKCLLPPFIAATCPQLTQLKIVKPSTEGKDVFTSDASDALPLTPCISLKQLHLDYDVKGPGVCRTTQLPPEYHTIEDLRTNLPNIASLIMTTPSPTLIEAYAEQLTRLEVGMHSPADDNAIRQCSRLERLSVAAFVLPHHAAALKEMEMKCTLCSVASLRQLLQLPSLRKVWLEGVAHQVKHDFSGVTCPWEELHLDNMGFFWAVRSLDFKNLNLLRTGPDVYFMDAGRHNLTNLKEWSCGPDMVIHLPNPAEPDSLAKEQRAVDSLAHIGKLTLKGSDTSNDAYGGCGTVRWDIRQYDNDHEQQAAELIAIAAQRIGPVRICNCDNLLDRPRVLDAVFTWGQACLETVCLGNNYELRPRVWQALKQLARLKTVVFWENEHEVLTDESFQYKRLKIPNLVHDAAEHYVIPTNRSLLMEFAILYNNDKEEVLVRESYPALRASVKENLPTGSEWVSIGLCRVNRYYLYGDACDADAMLVAVVAPLKPTA